MTYIQKILILLLSTALLTACMSSEEKDAVNKIDELIEQNRSAYADLNGVFFDSVKTYLNLADEKMAEFKSVPIDSFTLELEDYWEARYHMQSVQKMLSNYENKHLPRLNKDLELSKLQLTSLRHDIKNNLISEEEMQKYLQQEDSVHQFIMGHATERIKHVRAHFSKYDENFDDFDTLIKLMKE
jgi:hypothetical protein